MSVDHQAVKEMAGAEIIPGMGCISLDTRAGRGPPMEASFAQAVGREPDLCLRYAASESN